MMVEVLVQVYPDPSNEYALDTEDSADRAGGIPSQCLESQT